MTSTARPASRRRVWIVNHYAARPDDATGTRHYDLARRLVARGHHVTIFAAGRSHRSGREVRVRPGRLYHSETINGVRFVWLRTSPYHGNTWRRQLNMLSFLVVFVVVQTRFARPDIVIGSTVHPFAALGGWLAARLRGARFAFEIRDLWPQTLIDLGAMRRGSPGERLLRALEAFLVRRASAVITLLPGVTDYLAEQGLPSDHVVYLPNGADLTAFPKDGGVAARPTSPRAAQAIAEIERMQADGRFVVGYLGAFGLVNRVDLLARAAAIIEASAPGRIGLVLIGDGPERAEVERAAAAAPAAARVVDPVPKLDVPAVLRALDAAAVHTTYTPVYRYGISFNKLFEYMAAERPVVFATSTAYDPVARSGAGLTVEPDDAGRLADAFLEMASLPAASRAAMGAAGRSFVQREHDLDALGAVLAAVVEGRSADRPAGPGHDVASRSAAGGQEPVELAGPPAATEASAPGASSLR